MLRASSIAASKVTAGNKDGPDKWPTRTKTRRPLWMKTQRPHAGEARSPKDRRVEEGAAGGDVWEEWAGRRGTGVLSPVSSGSEGAGGGERWENDLGVHPAKVVFPSHFSKLKSHKPNLIKHIILGFKLVKSSLNWLHKIIFLKWGQISNSSLVWSC